MASALLIIHLLGVAVWLGSSVAISLMWRRSERLSDADFLTATGHVAWMSKRLAMPASIAVFLAGGALVSVANWDFSAAWIHVGSALLIAAALVGIFVVGRGTKTLIASLTDGVREASAIGRMKFGLIAIQLMLVVAIWDMVAKPF